MWGVCGVGEGGYDWGVEGGGGSGTLSMACVEMEVDIGCVGRRCVCTWAGLHQATSCVRRWSRRRKATYTLPTTGSLL